MKNIRAIRTEADYDWALAEIEQYFLKEPEPGTAAAERFDVLAALIEAYEAKHWPIEPADPEAIGSCGPSGICFACLRNLEPETPPDDRNGLQD